MPGPLRCTISPGTVSPCGPWACERCNAGPFASQPVALKEGMRKLILLIALLPGVAIVSLAIVSSRRHSWRCLGQRPAEEGPAEAEAPAGDRQSVRAVRRRLRPGPGLADLREDSGLHPDRRHHIGTGALTRAVTVARRNHAARLLDTAPSPSPRKKLSKRHLLAWRALRGRKVSGIVSQRVSAHPRHSTCVAPRDPQVPREQSQSGRMPTNQPPVSVAISRSASPETQTTSSQRFADYTNARRVKAGFANIRSPLGLSVFVAVSSGVALAVYCTIWAIQEGVPHPLAIMVGYCTVASSACVCTALLAIQSLAAKKSSIVTNRGPNYAAWKVVSKLSVSDASRLWCDIEPGCPASREVHRLGDCYARCNQTR